MGSGPVCNHRHFPCLLLIYCCHGCACSMAAMMRALSPLPSFLFVLLLLEVCFVHVAVSLIQYDQQTLLDIRSSLGKDYFTKFNSSLSLIQLSKV